MQASNSKPHILIAGAGIGGLVLAQCLRAQNHPFTIFDRDASAHSRKQGWAIALHTVLDELMASISDDMPSIEIVNHLLPREDLSAQLCFYDVRQADRPPMKFMVESKSRQEVGYGQGRVIRANRDKLRTWLLTNIDVQWGKHVVGYKQNEKGVTVDFADGSEVKGDFLVGAEGVKSAVRDQLIPQAKLRKVPECFVTGEVTLPKEQCEEQLKLAHSSYVVASSGFNIFVGLNKLSSDGQSGDYYWSLIWTDEARARDEPHWTDSASSEELYDFVVKTTAKVDPALTEIIHLTDPQRMQTPPMILRDLVPETLPISNITLLGDAAHAMVPFQGEGGCHAIDDALRLARVLTTGGSVEEYQKEMLERTSRAVSASRAAGDHSDSADNSARRAWGQQVKPAP